MQKDEQKKKYSRIRENPFGFFCTIAFIIIAIIITIGAIYTQLNK